MTADITWPERYLPGTTDNFVSNEVIVKGLSAAQVWPFLVDISKWESYYDNCGQITPPSHGPILEKGDSFSFSTFGFAPLDAKVAESVAPSSSTSASGEAGSATSKAGRLSWTAAQDGSEDQRFDIYHAWIVEDLSGGRVRILTQESQNGKPAAKLAQEKPNPMLLGHQNWLDSLATYAKEHSS
jgi:hypothetical protein